MRNELFALRGKEKVSQKVGGSLSAKRREREIEV